MFFLILLMASSGMTVLPSLRIGVTSTSSQTMGTCNVKGQFRFSHANPHETYLGCLKDFLDTVGNFRANTITGDEGDGVVALQIHHTAMSAVVFHLLLALYTYVGTLLASEGRSGGRRVEGRGIVPHTDRGLRVSNKQESALDIIRFPYRASGSLSCQLSGEY